VIERVSNVNNKWVMFGLGVVVGMVVVPMVMPMIKK
jgi:type II secretory pathway component PulF